MINIITIICHLTPNETLNEPQHSNFLELMDPLEALIQPSSPLSSGRMWPCCNKSPTQSGHTRSLSSRVFLQLLCYFPWCFLFALQLKTSWLCSLLAFPDHYQATQACIWDPFSASLPLGTSPSSFSGRPDCEYTQTHSYHSSGWSRENQGSTTLSCSAFSLLAFPQLLINALPTVASSQVVQW